MKSRFAKPRQRSSSLSTITYPIVFQYTFLVRKDLFVSFAWTLERTTNKSYLSVLQDVLYRRLTFWFAVAVIVRLYTPIGLPEASRCMNIISPIMYKCFEFSITNNS